MDTEESDDESKKAAPAAAASSEAKPAAAAAPKESKFANLKAVSRGKEVSRARKERAPAIKQIRSRRWCRRSLPPDAHCLHWPFASLVGEERVSPALRVISFGAPLCLLLADVARSLLLPGCLLFLLLVGRPRSALPRLLPRLVRAPARTPTRSRARDPIRHPAHQVTRERYTQQEEHGKWRDAADGMAHGVLTSFLARGRSTCPQPRRRRRSPRSERVGAAELASTPGAL